MEVSAKTGHNVEQAFYKMASEVHEQTNKKKGSRDGSNDARSRGSSGSREAAANEGVMADRVKLRPNGNSSSKNNKYAGANEVPSGLENQKKKKCCA